MSGVAQWVRMRTGNWKVIVPLGAAYLLSQTTIAFILHDLDPVRVLRLQTTLSADVFTSIIDGWREAGLLDLYWRHYWFDFSHPLLYGGLLAALLAMTLERNQLSAAWTPLLLMPMIAAGLDLFENLAHVTMLSKAGSIDQPWVALSGLAASCKWVFVLASACVVLILAVREHRLRVPTG